MGNPRIIEKQCTITDMDGSGSVTFQMMPNNISISKSVNWNYIDIIGRSHPILGYISSSPKMINFTLMFFANPSSEDPTTLATVSKNLKFFESMAYPDYSGGRVNPPHRYAIKIGKQVSWEYVPQDVTINLTNYWYEGLPVYASVSCTFIETGSPGGNGDPVDYRTVRG
jgi:hypothetical protein